MCGQARQEETLFMTQPIVTQITAEIKIEIRMAEEISKNREKNHENSFDKRYGAKWDRKKQSAKEMAKRMREIGEVTRAIRMENCAEIVGGTVCQSCGQMHVQYANLCRDRFCPICKWRLSMQRFRVMYEIIEGLRSEYPESPWQFVTLTCQNCTPYDLGPTMDEMSRVWNNITTSKKFKAMVAGWARSTEITYNAKMGTLHPHFHILLMYHELGEVNDYVIKRWLKGMTLKTNEKAQNAEEIIWSTEDETEIGWKIDQDPEDEKAIGAILETFKYATKDSEILDLPVGIFWYVTRALANRRLVSYGGLIKEYAKERNIIIPDQAEEGDHNDITECVKCRSRDLIEVLGKWTGDRYIWRQQEWTD